MLSNIKSIKPYLKDFLALVICIFLGLIYYKKLSFEILNIIKLEENHILKSNYTNNTKEPILKDKELSFDQKILSLFQQERQSPESQPKIPSFEEVLFGKEYGNIRLIAITGTNQNKNAVVIDHMNNLRIFKIGDRVGKNTIVSEITYTSIKFKSKNKFKELFLYRKEDSARSVQPEVLQPTIIRPHPGEEEIIEDEGHINEDKFEKFKRPGDRFIR